MKNVILIPLFICACSDSLIAQKVSVSGYITDKHTSEVLIGAHVYNKKTGLGATSNEYGFYHIKFQAADKIQLAYTYLGYRDTIIEITAFSDTVINIGLLQGIDIGEVEITHSGRQLNEKANNISIPIKHVTHLPSFGGEFDLMKTFQLMPGVQSGNEGNSGLYIRGGGPDQNLILLDDVPLYYVNHLAGFISTFNADAINNIKLIKGGYPAKYGGRLSSILDIRMKDGNMNEFKGSGSIGMLSSKIAFEGPIKKDTTSFIISGRRFMYDLISRPLTRLAEDNVIGYTFYDLNIKVNHKLSFKDRMYLSWYSGDDSSIALYNDPGEDNDMSEGKVRWGNLMGSYRWNHVYNQKLFSNFSLSYTRFRFKTTAIELQDAGDTEYYYKGLFRSGINDIGARIDYNYYPDNRQVINFGLGSTYHTFKPWSNSYYRTEGDIVTTDTITGSRNFYAWEHYIYLQDKILIFPVLNLDIGIRASDYSSDELSYKSIDPRLTLNFSPGNSSNISVSYTKMQQYVHLLSYSTVGIPIDLWMPATENVPPSQSRQISIGYTQSILKRKYDFSLEGYYKKMDNLIEYKPGASIIESTVDWQELIEQDGQGKSYGVEVLIRKNAGRLTGWIGYTWSKTTHQFENLNNGIPYPYKFDRNHDLSLVLMYKINDDIDISATWVYGTGNAFSLPEGKYNSIRDNSYYNEDQEDICYYPAYIYGEKNNYRMRSYHRLDVGANFRKDTRWGERTWNFSIYNLYNRKNPYYYFMDYSWNGKTTLKQKSLFPVMPSVSYSFKF